MTIEAALALPIFIFFMLSVLYVFQIIHVQAQSYQALHQRGNRIAFSAYGGQEGQTDSIVSLSESYRIQPFMWWQDFGRLRVEQQYYAHAWVGYDLGGEAADDAGAGEYVYIAETGVVYHLTNRCSYLNLSVSEVLRATIPSLRNDSGAKYYPCERCPDTGSALVYITSQGNRHHSDRDCSGLKRTVTMILKNEAIEQGYGGCSRCAS